MRKPKMSVNWEELDLTGLPLEIMHCGHDDMITCDLEGPWLIIILLYNLQLGDIKGTDFKNSLYVFNQSEKR